MVEQLSELFSGPEVRCMVRYQRHEHNLIEEHSLTLFLLPFFFTEPHKAVLQQSKSLPSKIYVSARAKGSPAYQYGLVRLCMIKVCKKYHVV